MRTVGEILKKERLERNITHEDIEKQIKVRKKFLKALEANNWNKLPSLPYIKGFIQNYSKFLNLNPDEMLAIFRRQYQYHEKESLLPEGVTKPVNQPLIRFTPKTIIVTVSSVLLIIFFLYLAAQYRSYVSPPSLMIDKPTEGEVISDELIQIIGSTDNDAVVEINNKKIALSQDGSFSTKITLTPGVNTIVIESISKYGKRKTVTRTVSVQPLE